MNAHNTRRLMARYPRLYGLAKLSPRHSNMCFGFECGDGWHDIIDRVSWWFTVLWKLFRVEVKATQVKEKLGGLRFYHYPQFPCWMPRRLSRAFARFGWWLEDWALLESEHTCESCGRSGRHGHVGYWVETSCEACAREGFVPYER